MQRLEVTGAVRRIYTSLGAKGLNVWGTVKKLGQSSGAKHNRRNSVMRGRIKSDTRQIPYM